MLETSVDVISVVYIPLVSLLYAFGMMTTKLLPALVLEGRLKGAMASISRGPAAGHSSNSL